MFTSDDMDAARSANNNSTYEMSTHFMSFLFKLIRQHFIV